MSPDSKGGTEGDKPRFTEEQLREEYLTNLRTRMQRSWQRKKSDDLRVLFAREIKHVRDQQLHATMVQTKVRLRGTGWRSIFAIFDTGSPVTMIKQSLVPEGELRPDHTSVRWGSAGRAVVKGRTNVDIAWTERTKQAAEPIVIPDNELPTYVHMLIGNDVILKSTHTITRDAVRDLHFLTFPGDPTPVEFVSDKNRMNSIVEPALQRQYLTDLLTAHETGIAVQPEEIELRAMSCQDGVCTKRQSQAIDARVYDVTAAHDVVIPARSTRVIVGRIERGQLNFVKQDRDLDAVFFPNQDTDHMAWTAQITIPADNPDPWMPIRVTNLTANDIDLFLGTKVGEAHTDVAVIKMTTGGGFEDAALSSGGHHAALENETGSGEKSELDVRLVGNDNVGKEEQAKPRTATRNVDGAPSQIISEAFQSGNGSDADVDGALFHGCGVEEPEWEEETPATFSVHGPGQLVGGGDTDVDKERLFLKSGIVSEEQAIANFDKMIEEVRTQLAKESQLSPAQVDNAISTLERNKRTFVEPAAARADHPEYPLYIRIPTTTATPVNLPPYRYPADKLTALQTWAETQLQRGHIEPTTSAWNAPMVLARKKDGRWRFAIDLRGLNKIALFDPYVLPRIPDLIELTRGAQWFSALDLTDGYWNVLIHPSDREKTSFTVPGMGRFHWRSMPFGFHGSGPHFQRAVEACMAGLSWQDVAVYVDDILIYSEQFDRHVELVGHVLEKLATGGFSVAPAKCKFFAREIPYLGHVLSQRGVATQPALVAKIVESMAKLTTKSAVRRALGVAQFYSRFIWKFSTVTAALSDAVRKDVLENLSNLSAEERRRMDEAATKLQTMMTTAPTLALPDYEREFVLVTDASDVGIGAMLGQEDDEGHLRPVAFWSRKLSETEKKYSPTEREALAIVFFTEKFRYYLLGRRFLIRTDHRALEYIFKGAANNSKLARWALRLQEFCFDVVYIKGTDNVVADNLSRRGESPVEEWNVSRAHGLYVRGPGIPDGEAIIPPNSIKLPQQEGERVFALTEERPDLVALQREDRDAMALRRIAAGEGVEAITSLPEEDKRVWRSKASKWRERNELQERKGLLMRVTERRDQFDVVEQDRERVVAPECLRRMLMADAHDATWAGHFAEEKTRERILRRWWWPTIRRDVHQWVRACEDCAAAGRGKRRSFGTLSPIQPVLRPFERIAIDTVDVVTGGQAEFPYCLTVVDYCTRYAMAIPLRNKTARDIAQALVDRVIAYFGPPEELLADNAGDLRGIVSELAQSVGTRQLFTSTYHPRANGLVERFNATFLAMMRTVLGDYKHSHWHRYVGMAQLAYNTAVQSSTGYPPHFLMFGREPVTPLETKLLWPRDALSADQWIKQLLHARDKAHEALLKVQEQQKARFDRKRAEAEFAVGERVFLRVGAVPRGVNPKTFNRYRGPYRVVKFKSGEAVVEIEHDNVVGQTVRVSVDRVIKVGTEITERLTPLERHVLQEWEDHAARDHGVIEAEVADGPMKEHVEGSRRVSKGKEELDAGVLEAESTSATATEPGRGNHEAVETRSVPGSSAESGARSNVKSGMEELQYELKTIWAHRNAESGTEYLVEYAMPKGSREGQWVEQEFVDAEELIEDYWKRLRNDEVTRLEGWKKRCNANGYDRGCVHLQCRASSQHDALDEFNDAEKGNERESKRRPDRDLGVGGEFPPKESVLTRSGRHATKAAQSGAK